MKHHRFPASSSDGSRIPDDSHVGAGDFACNLCAIAGGGRKVSFRAVHETKAPTRVLALLVCFILGITVQSIKTQGQELQETELQFIEEALETVDRAEETGSAEHEAEALEAVSNLAELYAAVGAPELLDELRILATESTNDAVREEAQSALDAASTNDDVGGGPAQIRLRQAIPFSVFVVSVECNGECTDSTLSGICSLAGEDFVPLVVDCDEVDIDPAQSICPPAPEAVSDNFCFTRPVDGRDQLQFYCDDQPTWDANVYCARALR